ncbi:MAG: tRNA (adenosine(37)-N6)-threonylcarbamoyltransferase complex ATPase subunit type 1 TsaE [Bacteroidota bacterium]|nr:tRNA (adenosine(37)-N6)-threonylcarbamoyltransferase complex ATPase subunit type 1 TsaE [Bacteroidota bacterium]
MESYTYKLEQLTAAAEWVLLMAEKYTIVAFEGEMGMGKTTLIQAICNRLNIEGKAISPSYSLVNEYTYSKKNHIYHFDFYRINSEQEAIDAGFYEYLDSGNLCLIEWPQKISKLLTKEKVLYININLEKQNERILRIN